MNKYTDKMGRFATINMESNLYASPNAVRVINLKNMRWVGM